jgi:hypothetical protein
VRGRLRSLFLPRMLSTRVPSDLLERQLRAGAWRSRRLGQASSRVCAAVVGFCTLIGALLMLNPRFRCPSMMEWDSLRRASSLHRWDGSSFCFCSVGESVSDLLLARLASMGAPCCYCHNQKKGKGVIVGEDFLGVQLYIAAREYSRCAVAV